MRPERRVRIVGGPFDGEVISVPAKAKVLGFPGYTADGVGFPIQHTPEGRVVFWNGGHFHVDENPEPS